MRDTKNDIKTYFYPLMVSQVRSFAKFKYEIVRLIRQKTSIEKLILDKGATIRCFHKFIEDLLLVRPVGYLVYFKKALPRLSSISDIV